MFNWFNMKKKTLPQQVLENTKDIEKLYDQELSDITQLNYKQDAEDSLTYADGKATFKGKMSIIRNENTQNLVVDSDIEVNISSGDDDIIIDAGEDNVSLKIRLDNATRNKISRALLTPISPPSEREFVMIGTNNAQEMVGEKEIISENYIGCRMASRPNFVGNIGNYVKIPLIAYASHGNKLNVVDESIVVGDGVSVVEISAQSNVYKNTGDESKGVLYIFKNNEEIIFREYENELDSYISANIPITPFYLSVTSGDIITLQYKLFKGNVSPTLTNYGTIINVREVK